jgi:hypothetical protein
LQARHEDHRGRLHLQFERHRGVAHQMRELAVDDSDERLARRERPDDLLADRLVAHGGDEILDDRQRDVGFEQCEPHLAQRVGNVGVGEARFAAQRLDDSRQPFGQRVEHRVLLHGCARRARLARDVN